jgi:protein transport protein SEC20
MQRECPSDPHSARTRFRAAQVQSQRNARAARAQERQLLFSARASESTDATSTARRRAQQDRPRAGGDEAVAASEDVTAALRRTQHLLHAEVERSRFAQEMFDQSTEAIKQLSKQYTDLDTLLANSRSLISTLVTSTKSDTWYLVTTFYILVGTIGWLVFRRFLYGPLWWLVWIPLKLLFRVAFFSLGFVGATSSSQSQSVSVPEIQSSATVAMASMPQASAKAEAQEKDTELKGRLSQQIADMGKGKGPVTRGDGEPLVYSDEPRNPKKRMFEAQVDDQGEESKAKADKKGEVVEGESKAEGKDEL